MNELLPGDVVVIPDRRPKVAVVTTGARHIFRRKGVPAVFRLQLFAGEEPRSNVKYRLVVDPGGQGSGLELQGTTDADGVLKELVSPSAKRGELYLAEEKEPLVIDFGHLDPIGEVSGIQKRLGNLGFDPGTIDNQLNAGTRDALRRFQQRFGLAVTGEADEETRSRLAELHDQVSSLPPTPARDDAGRDDKALDHQPIPLLLF